SIFTSHRENRHSDRSTRRGIVRVRACTVRQRCTDWPTSADDEFIAGNCYQRAEQIATCSGVGDIECAAWRGYSASDREFFDADYFRATERNGTRAAGGTTFSG